MPRRRVNAEPGLGPGLPPEADSVTVALVRTIPMTGIWLPLSLNPERPPRKTSPARNDLRGTTNPVNTAYDKCYTTRNENAKAIATPWHVNCC